MDLNKLITKRIKEYALDGEVDLLDKYGFLFNMIAKDYAEAINYTHCCKSDSEGRFQAIEDLKDLCYDVCPLDRRDDLSEIVQRL